MKRCLGFFALFTMVLCASCGSDSGEFETALDQADQQRSLSRRRGKTVEVQWAAVMGAEELQFRAGSPAIRQKRSQVRLAEIDDETDDTRTPRHRQQLLGTAGTIFLDEENPIAHKGSYRDIALQGHPLRNWGNLELDSVGIDTLFFDAYRIVGTGFLDFHIATPPSITTVKVPRVDGELVDVSPPLNFHSTYRRFPFDEEPPDDGNLGLTFSVNGIDLGTTNLPIFDGVYSMSMTIPATLGEYQVSSNGEVSGHLDDGVGDITDTRSASHTVTIPVRQLEFENDFEPIAAQSGSSISITNSFDWDRGGDPIAEASWSVDVSTVFGEEIASIEGTGPDIDAQVDIPEVLAQGEQDAQVVLLPEGSMLAQAAREQALLARARGEDLRAQSQTVNLFYQVKAKAAAQNSTDSSFYRIQELDGDAAATPAARVYDFEITPSPFFPTEGPGPRQMAAIYASVEYAGFNVYPNYTVTILGTVDGQTEPLKEWTYFAGSDEDEEGDPNNPDELTETFFNLHWDGYGPDGQPVDPQVVSVQVSFCGGSPEPFGGGNDCGCLDRLVRAQEEGGGCGGSPVASLPLGVGQNIPELDVKKVRFGKESDLLPSDLGPYNVYNYITEKATAFQPIPLEGQSDAEKRAQPHWTNDDVKYPAVFGLNATQSELYVGVEFNEDTDRSIPVTLRGQIKNETDGSVVPIGPVTKTIDFSKTADDYHEMQAVFPVSVSLATVGRYSVKLEWFEEDEKLQDTPTDTSLGHMIYLTLGKPDEKVANGNIFYSSDFEFMSASEASLLYPDVSVPVPVPPDVSPIDAVTTIANGASQPETILGGLLSALNTTEFAFEWSSSFRVRLKSVNESAAFTFRGFLRSGRVLDSKVVNSYLWILSANAGVRDAELHIFFNDPVLISRYVTPIVPVDRIGYALPEGLPSDAVVCDPVRKASIPPVVATAPNNGFNQIPRRTVQLVSREHSALFWNNKVYDASIKPTNLGDEVDVNPHLAANQRNLDRNVLVHTLVPDGKDEDGNEILLDVQETLETALRRYLLVGLTRFEDKDEFFAASSQDYRVVDSSENSILGLEKSQYLKLLLYLWDPQTSSPPLLRARECSKHNFNPKEAVYKKLLIIDSFTTETPPSEDF